MASHIILYTSARDQENWECKDGDDSCGASTSINARVLGIVWDFVNLTQPVKACSHLADELEVIPCFNKTD